MRFMRNALAHVGPAQRPMVAATERIVLVLSRCQMITVILRAARANDMPVAGADKGRPRAARYTVIRRTVVSRQLGSAARLSFAKRALYLVVEWLC
jgi:hypothetical protein